MYTRDHLKRLIQRILFICCRVQDPQLKRFYLSVKFAVSFHLSENNKMLHEEISPDGAKFVVLIWTKPLA